MSSEEGVGVDFDQLDQNSNINMNDGGDFIVNDDEWGGGGGDMQDMQLENSVYKGNDYYDNYQNQDPNIQDEYNENNNNYDDDDIIPGVDDLPLFALPEARKVDKDIKEKQREMEIIVEKISTF